MENRDVLKDILLQMQSLKLSSPLRIDDKKDENKENILAGQDLHKPKTERKTTDNPTIIITSEANKSIESECQETDVNSHGKSEESSPAVTSPVSENTVLNFEPTDAFINSECLVNDNNDLNATLTCEVNDLNSTNCELKSSTQSLYDDCIDAIGKNQEEHEIVQDPVSDPLNSTYCAEETFLSLQEPEELPDEESTHRNNTDIEQKTSNLNSTQVIEEVINTTIIKDEGVPIILTETLDSVEKSPKDSTDENSAVSNQSERCDHTFIEHSQDTESLPIVESCNQASSESSELPAVPSDNSDLPSAPSAEETSEHCKNIETFLSTTVEENNSTISSTDSETSLVNITKTNYSVEDLEASTANLVSDSSNRSLNTSLNNSQFSELNSSVKNNIIASLTEIHPQSSNSVTVNETVEEVNNSGFVAGNIDTSSVEVKNVSSILTVETVDEPKVDKTIEVTSNIPRKKMEEMNEKLQQDFSDIKLELNASQQAKATLELELSKKEEIILKTQAECMKKEQQYVQEIKSLKEQLKEKANNIIEKDTKESKESLKDLEEALKDAKAEKLDFIKVLEEYEKTIAKRFADYTKLKEENVSLNRHLSNLELSFSDLHQKYEKAKTVIFGFKKNEDKLRDGFKSYQETFRIQEGRYESLKAHAQTQIDKCNVEILQQKEKSESDINKLKAIVKRLEIKNAALETSLEQKTKECMALAALCDEVTGKKF